MTNHEAYDGGYDAYWEGVDVSDNPYEEEKDADARLDWEQGWRKAREHDYDESEGRGYPLDVRLVVFRKHEKE